MHEKTLGMFPGVFLYARYKNHGKKWTRDGLQRRSRVESLDCYVPPIARDRGPTWSARLKGE